MKINSNNNMNNFSIEHLHSLLGDTEQDALKCQEYIKKYFFHTYFGIFFMNANPTESKKQFTLLNEKLDLSAYLPKGLQMSYFSNGKVTKFNCRKWFVEDLFVRYEIVLDLDLPPVDHDKKVINLMGKLKHAQHDGKQFDDCSATSKAAVKMMLAHIKSVWCSGNGLQFDYTLNWLSCTGRRKVKSALYLQSLEQTGKSIVIDFLAEHVFGTDSVLSTANMEVISSYTQVLEGRVLVNINEMPCISQGEWKKLMNKLKSLITDRTFDCRKMYAQPRVSTNTFNMIMTSNNDAVGITSTNYRRYKCLDVSNDRIGDRKYFDQLVAATMNDEAGLAMYLYLKEHYHRTGHNFNVDSFPTSDTFIEKMTERLETPLEFLKEKYIAKGLSLDSMPLKALHNQYSRWWSPTSKTEMYSAKKFSKTLKLLQSVTFKRMTLQGERLFCFTAKHEDVLAEFAAKGYIHELDNIDVQSEEASTTDSDVDDIVDNNNDDDIVDNNNDVDNNNNDNDIVDNNVNDLDLGLFAKCGTFA